MSGTKSFNWDQRGLAAELRSSLKGHKLQELTSATPAVLCAVLRCSVGDKQTPYALMATVKIKRFVDFLLTTSGALMYCRTL